MSASDKRSGRRSRMLAFPFPANANDAESVTDFVIDQMISARKHGRPWSRSSYDLVHTAILQALDEQRGISQIRRWRDGSSSVRGGPWSIIADDVRSLAIVTIFLLFAVALFGGFTYRVVSMVWGIAPDDVRRGEPWDVGHVPLILTGAALVGFSLALPEPMRGLINQAVAILMVR